MVLYKFKLQLWNKSRLEVNHINKTAMTAIKSTAEV